MNEMRLTCILAVHHCFSVTCCHIVPQHVDVVTNKVAAYEKKVWCIEFCFNVFLVSGDFDILCSIPSFKWRQCVGCGNHFCLLVSLQFTPISACYASLCCLQFSPGEPTVHLQDISLLTYHPFPWLIVFVSMEVSNSHNQWPTSLCPRASLIHVNNQQSVFSSHRD